MYRSIVSFLLGLSSISISFSQTAWRAEEPGSTEAALYREGFSGIGQFGIEGAPTWPQYPIHIYGYQESSESSPKAPRIQLEHSYLGNSGSQQNNSGNGNGPNSSMEEPERFNNSWALENKNGVLHFFRDLDLKVQMGSTKLALGSSGASFDFQVFGNSFIGNPVGGTNLSIYSESNFSEKATFSSQAFFEDQLIIGDPYLGASNYRLSVDGHVLCQEISVETVSQWNDHVLKPGYKLRDLRELEDYISENGHLPEIPSGADVIEDGYNMAEMDALLLKKIEELTLYVIELEKELSKN